MIQDKLYLGALNARVDTSCILENRSWPHDFTKDSRSSHKDVLRLQRACDSIHKNFLPFIFKLVPRYISARGLAEILECSSNRKENNYCFVLILCDFGLIKGIDNIHNWFQLVDRWE